MPQHVIGDMIKETTTTTGTGTVTLAGAASGYRSFADIGNGKQTYYKIDDNAGNWEIGVGTYTSSGTTLSRDTVLWTSAGNTTKISFAAGSKDVVVVAPAKFSSPYIITNNTNSTKAVQPADDTAFSSTAGNARGQGAVDLQLRRTAATQIASGYYSVISGGKTNTCKGNYNTIGGGQGNQHTSAGYSNSVIGGGALNQISKSKATISGGYYNVASGDSSTVCGGRNCTASGAKSTTVGGMYNTASGTYSVASGRDAKADKYGQKSHASGKFSAVGDCQVSDFVLRGTTTNNTQTEIFLDGSSGRMTIPSDTTWAFDVLIAARRSDADNESAAYQISGCIDNNAGTTALVGTNSGLTTNEDNVLWDASVLADDTNDALVIKVTGETSKTVKWVAHVRAVQVTA